MSWYLQIGAHAPQLFSALGLSRLERRIGSQKAGRFSFAADGALCDSDPLAVEGTLCAVLNGDQLYFQGRLHQIPRKGSGRSESVDYELQDAWHDFEKNVYQQQWNVIVSADAEGNPTTAAQYRSECILGMDLSGDALSSGEVITQIVNWAISVGANCQVGAIGVNAPVPFDEIRDLPCSECIKKMLRLTPDAVAWFDYTASPPAFNVTRRADCAPITLPFAGNLEEVDIKALPDLLAPCVVIRYLQENETDGVPSVNVIADVYPETATGLEYGAMVQTTRLAGSSATFQKQPVITTPIPQDETDSNAIPWLMRNTPWLRAFSADRITVNGLIGAVDPGQVNSNGDPKDSDFGDYPNQVISGDIAPWMNVHSAYVTVTAQISYNYPSDSDDESNAAMAVFGPDDGNLDGWDNDITLVVHVLATDAVTQTYAHLSSYTSGEPVPSGLAEQLYGAVSVLQYSGSYETVGTEVSAWQLGTVLNIAGGRPEWTGMAGLLQEIADDLDTGRTRLRFGPAGHLTLQDLMEHLRWNRTRTSSRHIKERTSGQPGDAPLVNGPGQGADTQNAPPPQPTHYPWEDFIDEQDNDDGIGVTWDVLLGYGVSSFAGSDQIDHSGPIEEFEISVGNDNSGWTGPDHDSSDLTNVYSVISGDDDYTKDRLWIGAMDDIGNGGSMLVNPSDPSIRLSPNLDPTTDTGDDQSIRISLSDLIIRIQDTEGQYIELDVDDLLIEIQDEDGSFINLDLSGSPIINISNANTGSYASMDENSANFYDDNTGGSIELDASTTSGKALSTQTIAVCVDGVAKSMLVIGSEPF